MKKEIIPEGGTSTADARSFDVAISAEIEETNPGQFRGAFYISNNFTSCCNSGSDDGTITFEVSGDEISNFVWNDIIPNCEGTFEGTGMITSENTFTVDFTGTDCDGDHVGSLRLAKLRVQGGDYKPSHLMTH